MTPHRIDVPEQIAEKFVAGDYAHDFYSCAKFGGNPYMGASGQIGEISRNFFYLYPFLRNSLTGQTVHHIFTLNGSNDAESRKAVPLLTFVDIAPHFGDQIAPKKNLGGMNRHFPAKRVKY